MSVRVGAGFACRCHREARRGRVPAGDELGQPRALVDTDVDRRDVPRDAGIRGVAPLDLITWELVDEHQARGAGGLRLLQIDDALPRAQPIALVVPRVVEAAFGIVHEVADREEQRVLDEAGRGVAHDDAAGDVGVGDRRSDRHLHERCGDARGGRGVGERTGDGQVDVAVAAGDVQRRARLELSVDGDGEIREREPVDVARAATLDPVDELLMPGARCRSGPEVGHHLVAGPKRLRAREAARVDGVGARARGAQPRALGRHDHRQQDGGDGDGDRSAPHGVIEILRSVNRYIPAASCARARGEYCSSRCGGPRSTAKVSRPSSSARTVVARVPAPSTR